VITEADIERLAELSRIAVGKDEAPRLAKDVDAILGFVGEVKAAAGQAPAGVDFGFAPVDTLRADDGVEATGASRDALLREAPQADGGFVKVQKVLGGPSNA
jgi:aspartyl-tRNA(Asn)/glutamyl-tRNA(Gln) amidotransferase subunit C